MSRMDDDAVRRLGAALAHADSADSASPPRQAAVSPDQLESIRATLRSVGSAESFSRSLTQAVAAYLNRPVRVSGVARGHHVRPREVALFVAEAGAANWWIEFDARLAWSLADAMIGGTGVADRPKDARRTDELVARVATIFLGEIAASAACPPPAAAIFSEEIWYDEAQIIGTCAVGADAFDWRAGIALASRAAERVSVPTIAIADRLPLPSAAGAPSAPELTPVERVRMALSAAFSAVDQAVRFSLTSGQPAVNDMEEVRLPPAAIRLALTAGGSGAMVLSAPRAAVAAFASGAAGVPAPTSEEPGEIESAAAEAALRQLIREIADRLPRLRGVPQRIVHLAPDAQLARTHCVAATVAVRVAGNAASLNVIVPAWMTEPA